MTAPKPMTADEIVEALCHAQGARRDAIKAAMANMLQQIDGEREAGCNCRYCVAWRKLEEACRGK